MLFAPFGTKAQNLVLNPGFEQYTVCPDYVQDSGCVKWKGCESVAFPKGYNYFSYYNECAPQSSGCKPPNLLDGFRYPRTGKAFTEQRFYNGKTGYRWVPENFAYIEGQLSAPLKAGQWCYARFFVSQAAYDNSQDGGKEEGGSIADIGIYLSAAPTDIVSYTQALPFVPQVRHDTTQLITDTLNWTEISGAFQAKGGEKYITLGCFNNNYRVRYGGLYPAFYYIDDVMVTAFNYWVHDTSVCLASPLLLNSRYNNIYHIWQDSSTGDSFVVRTPGTYWVHYENDTSSGTDTFRVYELPNSQCNYRFLVHDTSVCALSPLMIYARFGTNILHHWQDSSTGDSFIVTNPGIYWVRYGNDTFTAADTFKVKSLSASECNCNVYAPTAFTPFGDHLNDSFIVTSACDLHDIDFEVYNRWGERVYQNPSKMIFSPDQRNEFGWDGAFHGTTCPQGLYLWRMSAKNINNQTITSKGIVFLLENSKY